MPHRPNDRQPKTGVLSPTAIEVAKAGVDRPEDMRCLITGLRFVLMAAHYAGMNGQDVGPYVYDREYLLAQQLAWGRTDGEVEKLVNRHWRETERRYNARDKDWNVADALNIVKAGLAHHEHLLNDRERLVMWMAVAEAERLHTTRPVLPENRMAALTGIPHSTTGRIIARLGRDGWLRVVVRGRRGIGENARATKYAFGTKLCGVSPRIPRDTSTYTPPSSGSKREEGTTYTPLPTPPADEECTTYTPHGRMLSAQPMHHTNESEYVNFCRHGLVLVAPGRESIGDRLDHAARGFEYVKDCWVDPWDR